MNTHLLILAFGALTCLTQFGIGWYGWRNPRAALKIPRKIVSAIFLAWAAFSVTRVVAPDFTANDEFIAQYGMTMYVVTYGLTLVVLGALVVVVRKKYLMRIREAEQAH